MSFTNIKKICATLICFVSILSAFNTFAAPQQAGYLTGPDGSSWSYTARYEMDYVYVSEYYTEEIIKSFTFTIYNNRRQVVGTIHDKIRYSENETKDRECVLNPTVSLKFFNTDDKPEVMVFHAINTKSYVNHYYYDVYSIGGAKDSEGYDKAIYRIEGRFIESVNNPQQAYEENFYYTFVQDPIVDFPLNDPDYVEKLNNTVYRITTYKKAVNNTDGPEIMLVKDIYNNHIPGDTTEGIYFMSKWYENRLFFIYSQYDLPYFIDPRGSAEDERATPDNSLVIDVYELTHDRPDVISQTKIPVNAEESDEQLIYTFLGIGAVTWKEDVDMQFHGTPDAPAFLVTRSVATAADIENMKHSYMIYDNEGNMVTTLAEDTEGLQLFRNGDPGGPLAMFVKKDKEGNYEFIFAYLFSGERIAAISQANNGDPLYASCYPLKIGDEYKFVFEMKNLELDPIYKNTYARVAWFGRDAKLERIDRINIGFDVQAAMVYLANESLNPTLFDNDEEMEYAVLVKRTHGNTARNEYLLVDDNGGWFRTFTADDGRGEPVNLTIYTGRPNRVVVQYSQGSVTVNLPFDKAAEAPDYPEIPDPVDPEPEEPDSGVSIVIGEGLDIDWTYYDLQGRKVVNPQSGMYIRRKGGKSEKVIL